MWLFSHRGSKGGAAPGFSISDEKYRALVENLPAITYVVKIGFRIRPLYVSPQIETILGYSRGEWMADARLSYRLLHPEDRSRVIAEIRHNLPTGKPFSIVYRKIARDGRIVWFRNHADWLRNEEGRTRFIQGVMLDITDQMQTQENLNRSDAILRAVRYAGEQFLHANSWRQVIDAVLMHIRDSAEASRVYLYEFDGGHHDRSAASRRYEAVADGIAAQIKNPQAQNISLVELGLRRWFDSFKIGSPIRGVVEDFPPEERPFCESQGIVSLVAKPIIVRNELWGFIGVDSSSRRVWSDSEVDALKAATTMLAAAIDHERTAQTLAITEDHLRQSQKMEAIGRLAGGVAHDFNNLLTSILGYANLVHDKLGDHPQLQRDMSDIIHAGNRAADLTRQLLLFGRKQMAEVRQVDINDNVRDLQKILQRTIGEDITVYLELENTLHKVEANSGQIEQIIMNLVLNARDAMPQGGTLTIRTQNIVMESDLKERFPSAEAPLYVLLAVRDTGSGMTEEIRQRIFEPFFTTKELGRGVGLGLAIVYSAVTQWGGFIDVKSKPGEGTEFNVYLPATTMPQITAEKKTPAAHLSGAETILVVEDEKQLRSLVTRILSDHGYRILTAANAIEALEIFDRHPGTIDLVLSDVVMPGMSGVQMIQHMQGSSRQFSVLYMTGFTDEALFRHGVEEKKVSVLFKPFRPNDLTSKIRAVLDAREIRHNLL